MPQQEKRKGSPAIAEDHLGLRQVLHQLGDTAALEHLAARLEDLEGDLKEHFSEEEAEDGLAAAIGSAIPHNLRHLDRLFAEHTLLLSQVADLAKRTRDIQDGLTSFCATLRRHEAMETELLVETVNTDLGTGD